MTKQKTESTSRYSISFWKAMVRAFAPAIVFLPFAFLLPTTPPDNGFLGLAWYQQIVSIATLPTLVWSLYRLHKIQQKRYKSPEERVLDD